MLIQYLHYRRLAGEGERLPRTVCELADADLYRRRRAATGRLLATGAGGPRAARLERELARLSDPTVVAARREAQRRRATNQLRRGVDRYRLDALRALLESAVVGHQLRSPVQAAVARGWLQPAPFEARWPYSSWLVARLNAEVGPMSASCSLVV
jgi:hypothetical protein